MLIKYYKHENLKFTSRKRFVDISSIEPFSQENQKKVLINDGAETSIKTSVENIADYVTIDETRWFVTSSVYQNGGQITLFLQRDVIGEKTLNGIYGKIERGFTETKLRNRKELSLNEVLKERIMIKPTLDSSGKTTYGNYSVNNHDNELWGVLYFTKPGEDTLISIKGFQPPIMDYPMIDNDTKTLNSMTVNVKSEFHIGVKIGNSNTIGFWCIIGQERVSNNWSSKIYIYDAPSNPLRIFNVSKTSGYNFSSDYDGANHFINNLCNVIVDRTFSPFPTINTYDTLAFDYDNAVISENNVLYRINKEIITEQTTGSITNPSILFEEQIGQTYSNLKIDDYYDSMPSQIVSVSKITYNVNKYNKSVLNPSESGSINILSSSRLIDEPYSVLVFPLYDVTINRGETTFEVERRNAFYVFNSVIAELSGENGLLVDAQIYPYCPNLLDMSTALSNEQTQGFSYPFFTIDSNTYIRNFNINLNAYEDVKKEYIKRKYTIISPEQTGSFSFNFYDYKEENTNLNIQVKTSLKPFALISVAVITPDFGSLKNITFQDSFNGCYPSGNGFQCSLSSNSFETYKRQNANYQQIFDLQKEELSLSHQTERRNEIASGIVNTITAASMGAIGGAAIGDTGVGSLFGTKTAGAISGGAIAGAVVGGAMTSQYIQNNKLREFEADMQQKIYDLNLSTIKAIPNTINRISSFNEIILSNFWYRIEVFECTEIESEIVDDFIERYGYSLNVFGYYEDYLKQGGFLKGDIVASLLDTNLANIASGELKGGIYYYE